LAEIHQPALLVDGSNDLIIPAVNEDRAAQAKERKQLLISLRYYRLCGAALLVAGIAGFVRQQVR
jgi:hypothetical protein